MFRHQRKPSGRTITPEAAWTLANQSSNNKILNKLRDNDHADKVDLCNIFLDGNTFLTDDIGFVGAAQLFINVWLD